MMPPPRKPKQRLAKMIVLVMVIVPAFEMPQPIPSFVLSEIVLFMTLIVPVLKTPPPSISVPPFLETVLFVMVTVPPTERIPPPAEIATGELLRTASFREIILLAIATAPPIFEMPPPPPLSLFEITLSLTVNMLRGESNLMHPRTTTRLGRNQSNKPYFTAETRSSQRSEYLLINNSLLCVLDASAVNSLPKAIRSE